ncbi:hypothetical protein K2Y11_11840 [bacterium]|nr:hypothetical protein [bacterium]
MPVSIALFVIVTAIAYWATIIYRLPEPKGDPRKELFSIPSADRFLRTLIFGCFVAMLFASFNNRSNSGNSVALTMVGIVAMAYWPFIIYVWIRPSRSRIGSIETSKHD